MPLKMRLIKKQELYNNNNNITPTPLKTKIKEVFSNEQIDNELSDLNKTKKDIDVSKMSNEEKNRTIKTYRKKMEIAAKALDFIEAARIRDLIKELKK